MSELLKPCPFCGSTDIAANSFAIEASVRCLDCCAVLVRTHPRNTDGGLAAVIEAWNTRADLSDALLREAADVLGWYDEQSRLARLIHSEGDAGRQAIAADGGGRASATLAKLRAHLEGDSDE